MVFLIFLINMRNVDYETMPLLTVIMAFILGLMLISDGSRAESNSPRIINGTSAEVGQFPYLVHLKKKPSGRCSGSLITSKKVLTACHCYKNVDPNSKIQNFGIAIAGDVFKDKNKLTAKSRQERKLVKLVKHPKYTGGAPYDMAILTTKTAFKLNKNVAVIPLAKVDLRVRQTCVTVGFGRQVLDSSKPVETDLAWFESTVVAINDNSPGVIKTGTSFQRSYMGDSGSPLIDNIHNPSIHGVLHGSLTQGTGTQTSYALISSANKWIINHSKFDRYEEERTNDSTLLIFSIWYLFLPCVVNCTWQIIS